LYECTYCKLTNLCTLIVWDGVASILALKYRDHHDDIDMGDNFVVIYRTL